MDQNKIKELREKTGAGFLLCKKALEKHKEDFEKAVEFIREENKGKIERISLRETSKGRCCCYEHPNGRVSVLLEVNCETDFVAETEEFKQLCKDLCMQIAAMNPVCIDTGRKTNKLSDLLLAEENLVLKQLKESGKPEKIFDKIIQGKLGKLIKEHVLIKQKFVKDDKKSVEDVIKEVSAKTGENITIKRFTRYELGED